MRELLAVRGAATDPVTSPLPVRAAVFDENGLESAPSLKRLDSELQPEASTAIAAKAASRDREGEQSRPTNACILQLTRTPHTGDELNTDEVNKDLSKMPPDALTAG